MTEPTDVIRLYLDDDVEPFKTARPPLTFQFSTLHLADGPHRLRVEAHNGLAGASVREVPFLVRNGVAITVSGINPGQEIAGQVGVIINAYAGNTEVDFEPSRAETPQPIPTWAWLIFLSIVAWTMFYLLNPGSRGPSAAEASTSEIVGKRVYEDVCGKCHQDDGMGARGFGPAKLRDADIAINEDPTDLVAYVAAGPLPEGGQPVAGSAGSAGGRPRVRMLAFGPPRLTLNEFVGALNHVRGSWGNQAPPIVPVAKRAPKPIAAVDAGLVDALQRGDAGALSALYTLGRDPRLVRTPEPLDVSSNTEVVSALKSWMASIDGLNSMQATEAAYFTNEAGDVVYAHGTMLLTVTPRPGQAAETFTGQFIRVYVNECLTPGDEANCPRDEHGGLQRTWRIAFDYATTPMPVGCAPGQGPSERCPPAEVGWIAYADVQRILTRLGQKAPHAPHGDFWDLPYAQFVALEFPYAKLPGAKIRLVNLDPAAGITGAETNFVKALRDGRDVVVEVPGEAPRRMDIERMPKGTKPVSPVDLGRIIAWLDHGMPETVAKKPVAAGDTSPAGAGMDAPTSTGPAAAPGTGVSFADVIAILGAGNPKATGSPHGAIWKLPYDKFVALEFDVPTEGARARLLVPGDPEHSNLLRALSGRPMVLVKDGKTVEFDLGRPMPPRGKGQPVSPEDLKRIEAWIAAGSPEKAGGPAAGGAPPPAPPGPAPAPSSGGMAPPPPPPPTPETPSAGMGAPAPPPPPTPVPAPSSPGSGMPPPPPPPAPAPSADPDAVPVPPSSAPPAPPPPSPAPPAPSPQKPPAPPPPEPAAPAAAAGGPPSTGWASDDLDFAGVIALLSAGTPKASGSPHGAIWKLPYKDFIAFTFDIPSEGARAKLLVLGDGARSNLVRALAAKPLIAEKDGKQIEVDLGRPMPPKGKGQVISDADIARIQRWIDRGAPEKRP